MYAEPTINDFLDNIRWHLDKACQNAQHVVNQVMTEHAGRGILESSMTMMRIFDEVRKEFDAGIEVALGELQRTATKTTLNRQELRQATAQCLTNFAIAMKSMTAPVQFKFLPREGIDQNLRAFDDHLKFKQRQFDVGFFVPHEPEPPQVTNSITVCNMTASPIMQGSPNANQSVEFNLDAGSARTALTAFETALEAASLSAATRASFAPEIQTLRAQLSKPSPSQMILREAGRSLRNIVEGVYAALLAPAAMAAATALCSALRLG